MSLNGADAENVVLHVGTSRRCSDVAENLMFVFQLASDMAAYL
jgi:hypothetical protein